MQILNSFQSQHLLLVAAVSRRFRDLATDLIYSRLILATSLQDRKLLLECYHPTNQYTEPYLFCESLHTREWLDGLKYPVSRGEVRAEADRFRAITTLYSSFKPIRADLDSNSTASIPTRAMLDDQNADHSSPPFVVASTEGEDELMTRTVQLESCELFSQLCTSVALVEVGPRRGVFLSCVDILKKKTIRIWRQWLLENSYDPTGKASGCVIWADQNQNVGLKVRVREIEGKNHVPVLQPQDENQAMSYQLDLEGVSLMSHPNNRNGQKNSQACSRLSRKPLASTVKFCV